jgi:hypothetical protein
MKTPFFMQFPALPHPHDHRTPGAGSGTIAIPPWNASKNAPSSGLAMVASWGWYSYEKQAFAYNTSKKQRNEEQ